MVLGEDEGLRERGSDKVTKRLSEGEKIIIENGKLIVEYRISELLMMNFNFE